MVLLPNCSRFNKVLPGNMQLLSIRAGRESLARPTIAAITTLNSAYTYSFLEIHRIFQEWKKNHPSTWCLWTLVWCNTMRESGTVTQRHFFENQRKKQIPACMKRDTYARIYVYVYYILVLLQMTKRRAPNMHGDKMISSRHWQKCPATQQCRKPASDRMRHKSK